MRDLLSIGTSRGCQMIGTGIGLGLAGYRLRTGQWTPSIVATLQLWLDASDTSTLLQSSGGSQASADGDPVGYWADKSGNGYHATQSDGTRKPALKTGVKNGRNILRFDGSNDGLTISGSASSFKFLHGSKATVFVVAKNNSSSDGMILCSNNGTAANTGYWFYFGSGTSLWTNATAAPSSIVFELSSTITATNYNLLGSISDATSSTIASRVRNYTNGSLLSGTNTANGTASTADSTFDVFIGRGPTAYPMNGDICEVLVFNSNLATTDRQNIEFYLNQKWSIY